MGYRFKDVQEFQKLHKTRAEREQILKTLTKPEIRHLAMTCNTPQGAAYYMAHIKDKK